MADCVGHPVTCVSYTNDGNCVLATCMDSKVRLFDKASGELLASYAGHKNSSYRVESCMTHGDAHVACGSEDGDVFFWDLVSGKQARPPRPWARCAAACACAPHAAAVLRPRRLNPRACPQVHKLSGHKGVVCGLAYHPSETLLLTASVDGTVGVWR